jgi:hypothetical protein
MLFFCHISLSFVFHVITGTFTYVLYHNSLQILYSCMTTFRSHYFNDLIKKDF